MDLNSIENQKLLRNCLAVKIKILQQDLDKSNIDSVSKQKELNYYTQIYQNFIMGNFEAVVYMLESTPDGKHILLTSPKDLACEYIDLVKNIMENSSPEKFEKFKQAFLEGNESLNANHQTYEYEEEPEENSISDYLTEDMKNYLHKLEKLVSHKILTPSQFRNFATQFRDITKILAHSKFQQSFDKLGKTITQMDILYEKNETNIPIYKTNFTLLNANSYEEYLTLSEPAPQSGFISTYYQSICYSYLEADKCSKKNDFSLDANTISNQMTIFKKCYTNLTDMSKCEFKIVNGKIIPLDHRNYEPSLEINITETEQSYNSQSEKDIVLG